MDNKEQKTEPGKRFDAGKLRYDLVPPQPFMDLVKVYTDGAQKYAERNWEKGMSWGRVFSAMMRHAWKFWNGEENDQESGSPHLAHLAWGCLTLLEFSRTKKEFDDRPKN